MTVLNNYYQPYYTLGHLPEIGTSVKFDYFGSNTVSNISNAVSQAISIDFSRVEALEKKVQELEAKVTLLSDLNAKLERLIDKADQLLEKPKEVLPYVEPLPFLPFNFLPPDHNFQPIPFYADYPITTCEGITLTNDSATWTMY